MWLKGIAFWLLLVLVLIERDNDNDGIEDEEDDNKAIGKTIGRYNYFSSAL